jgi:chaperone BCS1
MAKSALTFSGLLNALDGVGNTNGQVYVLTTNLRDQLDPALIRNGRVDIHIEFTYATEEQMRQMWTNFYPEADKDSAAQFASAVVAQLTASALQVTTAGLQHFFVTQMDSTSEEALGNVGCIVADILENNARAKEDAEAREKEEAEAAAELAADLKGVELNSKKEEGDAETKESSGTATPSASE